MAGVGNFLTLLQVGSLEWERAKRQKKALDEQDKRRMFALEKRHAAGEKLLPTEMNFLLAQQDTYKRPRAVPDPEIVVPELPMLAVSELPVLTVPELPKGKFVYLWSLPSIGADAAVGVGLGVGLIALAHALQWHPTVYQCAVAAILAALIFAFLGAGDHVARADKETP
jgi:hypothetical protein